MHAYMGLGRCSLGHLQHLALSVDILGANCLRTLGVSCMICIALRRSKRLYHTLANSYGKPFDL